jgi:hypothetical protein
MLVDESSTILADGSSTIPVSHWHGQIFSALQMIRDERDDSKYGATVDEVLDRILNNAIEAYGSSARDVYMAILDPTGEEIRIDLALKGMKYNDLHNAFMRMQIVAGVEDISHRIFSMHVKAEPARAHLTSTPAFEVHFRSRWVQAKALDLLDFLHDVDIAARIRELKDRAETSGLQASCTKNLPLKR